MKIGTKSVLFGAHAFWIHPFMVAYAWWRVYGFPWDPRLWVAFFVHDLGYWGCDDIDGPEGVEHPTWGATLMLRLFGVRWYYLCKMHSRTMARRYTLPPSRLAVADKLAWYFEPWWLYLPRAWLSGELSEYMSPRREDSLGLDLTAREWYRRLQVHGHREACRIAESHCTILGADIYG